MRLQRKETRLPSNSFFTVLWQETGSHGKSARSRCINVSKSGLRLQFAEQLEPGTPVCLEGEHHGLRVRATVRNCTRYGSSFAIGLEFGDNASGGYHPAPHCEDSLLSSGVQTVACLQAGPTGVVGAVGIE